MSRRGGLTVIREDEEDETVTGGAGGGAGGGGAAAAAPAPTSRGRGRGTSASVPRGSDGAGGGAGGAAAEGNDIVQRFIAVHREDPVGSATKMKVGDILTSIGMPTGSIIPFYRNKPLFIAAINEALRGTAAADTLDVADTNIADEAVVIRSGGAAAGGAAAARAGGGAAAGGAAAAAAAIPNGIYVGNRPRGPNIRDAETGEVLPEISTAIIPYVPTIVPAVVPNGHVRFAAEIPEEETRANTLLTAIIYALLTPAEAAAKGGWYAISTIVTRLGETVLPTEGSLLSQMRNGTVVSYDQLEYEHALLKKISEDIKNNSQSANPELVNLAAQAFSSGQQALLAGFNMFTALNTLRDLYPQINRRSLAPMLNPKQPHVDAAECHLLTTYVIFVKAMIDKYTARRAFMTSWLRTPSKIQEAILEEPDTRSFITKLLTKIGLFSKPAAPNYSGASQTLVYGQSGESQIGVITSLITENEMRMINALVVTILNNGVAKCDPADLKTLMNRLFVMKEADVPDITSAADLDILYKKLIAAYTTTGGRGGAAAAAYGPAPGRNFSTLFSEEATAARVREAARMTEVAQRLAVAVAARGAAQAKAAANTALRVEREAEQAAGLAPGTYGAGWAGRTFVEEAERVAGKAAKAPGRALGGLGTLASRIGYPAGQVAAFGGAAAAAAANALSKHVYPDEFNPLAGGLEPQAPGITRPYSQPEGGVYHPSLAAPVAEIQARRTAAAAQQAAVLGRNLASSGGATAAPAPTLPLSGSSGAGVSPLGLYPSGSGGPAAALGDWGGAASSALLPSSASGGPAAVAGSGGAGSGSLALPAAPPGSLAFPAGIPPPPGWGSGPPGLLPTVRAAAAGNGAGMRSPSTSGGSVAGGAAAAGSGGAGMRSPSTSGGSVAGGLRTSASGNAVHRAKAARIDNVNPNRNKPQNVLPPQAFTHLTPPAGSGIGAGGGAAAALPPSKSAKKRGRAGNSNSNSNSENSNSENEGMGNQGGGYRRTRKHKRHHRISRKHKPMQRRRSTVHRQRRQTRRS